MILVESILLMRFWFGLPVLVLLPLTAFSKCFWESSGLAAAIFWRQAS
jgi:hypothetical protein